MKPPARTNTGTDRSVPFRPRGGGFRKIPSLDPEPDDGHRAGAHAGDFASQGSCTSFTLLYPPLPLQVARRCRRRRAAGARRRPRTHGGRSFRPQVLQSSATSPTTTTCLTTCSPRLGAKGPCRA
eukprot:5789650-Prymnesium_polylepis.1